MAKVNKTKIKYLLLAFFSFIFLSFSLDLTPVHLNQDELMFSLNANSIAENLTDYYGNRLPFYFRHLDSFWATPIAVYLTSLVLKIFSISETTIRLSSVLVGVVSTLLMFALVKEVFNEKLALLSSILLLISPAFFINTRLLLDNIYPLPFVLLWLLLLKIYLDKNNFIYIFFASLSLGVGIHSYHAAKIMMPVYFVATIFVVFKKAKDRKKDLLMSFVGFLIPIILFIPWVIKYPQTLTSQINYVGRIDRSIEAEKGILGVFNLQRLDTFISSYPKYLGPNILFVEGDRSLIHSTKMVGAFTFPMFIPFIFGLLGIIYKRKDIFSKLVLFGFLTYPIAPSIVNDPQRISRGLVAIVFSVLIFTYGAKFLIDRKEKMFRHLLIATLSLSIIWFFLFWKDYFGVYRVRSYAHFNNNIGGALESAFRSTKIREVEKVYLDDKIPFVTYYSDFYQEKLGLELDQKIEYFDFSRNDFTTYGAESLFIMTARNALNTEGEAIRDFERIKIISEPDGKESFYVFYNSK